MDTANLHDERVAKVEALLLLARGGSGGALAEAIGFFKPYIDRVIWRQFRELGDARTTAWCEPCDLFQDACVDAVRDFRNFHGDSAQEFRCWLVRIVFHTVRDYGRLIRAEKRSARRERPLDAEGDRFDAPAFADRAPSAEALATTRERCDLCRRALEALTADERELIDGRFFQGLSLAELATLRGKSADAVRMRCSRILRRLHRMLEASSGDPD